MLSCKFRSGRSEKEVVMSKATIAKEMARSSRKVMKDSQKVIDEVREAAVKRKKKAGAESSA